MFFLSVVYTHREMLCDLQSVDQSILTSYKLENERHQVTGGVSRTWLGVPERPTSESQLGVER